MDYQILANTLILKLKYSENISAIFPIDILLMVMKSAILSGTSVRISIWILPVYVFFLFSFEVNHESRRKDLFHSDISLFVFFYEPLAHPHSFSCLLIFYSICSFPPLWAVVYFSWKPQIPTTLKQFLLQCCIDRL